MTPSFPLPPERPGHAAPADLAARRAGLGAAVASGLWRTDPEPIQTMIGGVRCLRFAPPPGHAPRATLLHLHGGAFRLGCPDQIAPFAAALAAAVCVEVICPAYRLAPEHPFPAGLNDARAVLDALAVTTGPLLLSGDSAGGGLAASLAIVASEAAIPLAGLALLSPWLDLSVTAPSYATNAADDPLFSQESALDAAKLYLQGWAADDPLASPLLAPPAHFPPTYINVGGQEVLLDDARRFHARLDAAGVAARIDVIDGMEHVAATRDRSLTGAAASFDGLAAFLDDMLGPMQSD